MKRLRIGIIGYGLRGRILANACKGFGEIEVAAICDRGVPTRDRAIAEFKKAAQDDPKHVNSRYNMGVVFLHDKGDMKGAIKAWEDYLKVEPAGPRAENIRNQMEKMRSMAK